jgi:hypothetical protein
VIKKEAGGARGAKGSQGKQSKARKEALDCDLQVIIARENEEEEEANRRGRKKEKERKHRHTCMMTTMNNKRKTAEADGGGNDGDRDGEMLDWAVWQLIGGGAVQVVNPVVTHSLKAPGFSQQPLNLKSEHPGFKPLLFRTLNLYRYASTRCSRRAGLRTRKDWWGCTA